MVAKYALQNKTFAGVINTRINLLQMIHETSVATLQRVLAALKTKLASLENLDSWSLSSAQTRKKSSIEEEIKFVDLLIGYKRFNEEVLENKKNLRELTANLQKLKEDSMTPAERTTILEAEIAKLKELVPEEAEEATEE